MMQGLDKIRYDKDQDMIHIFVNGKWKLYKQNPKRRYQSIQVNGKKTQLHRVIYELVFGPIPEGLMIDHIDGNPQNNHPSNLRAVTNRENSLNKKCHREGKLYGCYYSKSAKAWAVHVQLNGEIIYCGTKPTELEAHILYKEAIASLHMYETTEQFRRLLGTFIPKVTQGYSYDTSINKWKVALQDSGKSFYICVCNTEEEARAMAEIAISRFHECINPTQYRILLGVEKFDKGYTYDSKISRWKTVKSINGKRTHIACFKTEEEAKFCSSLVDEISDKFIDIFQFRALVHETIRTRKST